ncbi:MAG: NAD-dependent epimerase/dehydratase family protein [Cyanobacteria bacterium REEB67]|nr:NAD-dependent epimerase/dehydratase family protein [Cyanobacteria bacterium REEB67]
MNGKQVVVTGASGYLGQHVIAELIKQGASVRAVLRVDAPPADLAFLQKLGAVIYTGQLGGGPGDFDRAFSGADYGLHLIGSVAPPRGGPSVQELHQSYSLYFARACARAGLKKAVLVTALGADKNSASQYLASKELAETAFSQCLQEAGVACAIVRPSLIVGRLVGSRDSKLVDRYRTLLKTRPTVPLVGGGINMLEPVFVGDLAVAIVKILEQEGAGPATIYQIGGPEKMTMRQFVQALATSLSISKPLVNLPGPVAAFAAAILGVVQAVPLLSSDQVRLAHLDMVTEKNDLPALIAPQVVTPLSTALASYALNKA